MQLDTLASMFGIPRHAAFSRPAWRRALQAAGFGRRGTRGVVQSFLEAALSDSTVLTLGVSIDPGDPFELTAVGGGNPFTAAHANRLILLGHCSLWERRLVFSTGPQFISAPAGNDLELAPYDSGYWAHSNWASLLSGAISLTATVLPFTWREPVQQPTSGSDVDKSTWGAVYDGDTCTVEVDVDSILSPVPPTYMFPDPTIPIPAPEPNGGFIDVDVDATGPAFGGNASPYPLYMIGDSVDALESVLDPLLAAGVWAKARVEDFLAP